MTIPVALFPTARQATLRLDQMLPLHCEQRLEESSRIGWSAFANRTEHVHGRLVDRNSICIFAAGFFQNSDRRGLISPRPLATRLP